MGPCRVPMVLARHCPVSADLFGLHLQELRRRAELTQQALGEACGVKRNTINMIEKGHRSPSVDLLKKICGKVAPGDQTARARLLFALIDEEPSALPEGAPVMRRAPQQSKRSLWVATDEIGELLPEARTMLDATVAALRGGHERVYFVPSGFDWEPLVRLLRRQRVVDLEQRLRIASAPSVLCTLRMEIDPLAPGRAQVWVSAQVSDPSELVQVQLPSEQGNEVYRSLRVVLGKLLERKPVPGFSLLYPTGTARRGRR